MTITIRKIFYFILFLAIVATVISVLLYRQLNLEDYRQHLEQQLSLSLGQPVKIGRGKLTYRNGLALSLRDLVIGEEKAPLVEVPRLTATLEIAPLFKGQIILDKVQIDDPSLRIQLPMERRPARGTTHKIFDALGVNKMTISNASLRLLQRQSSGPPKQLLHINNFNALLTGWQSDQIGQLEITGQVLQKNRPAKFILDFSLPSSPDPATWRLDQLNYRLTLENLSTEFFPHPASNTFPTALNLQLSLNGIPATGADLSAEISSTDGKYRLFELTGKWTSAPTHESLTQLTGSLLGIPINGEGGMRRGEDINSLSGKLGADQLKLNQKVLDLWRVLGAEQLLGGDLTRLNLTVDKEWPAAEKIPGPPRIGLKLALNNLQWDQPELKQIEDVSLDLALNDQELSIGSGLLIVAGQPISFSGKIKQFPSAPQLDLDIHCEPDLAILDQQIKLPEGWSLSGQLPLRLQLQGSFEHPKFLFEADLTPSQLSLGQLLQKSPAQAGSLRLTGVLEKKQLELEELRLKLDNFLLTAAGEFPWQQPASGFQIAIDPFELTPLQAVSPLLSKLQLQGELQPVIEMQNGTPQGTLMVKDVGCYFYDIVGNLNQANGEIHFNDQGLEFNQLSARLGESLLTLDGRLSNWADPELNIALTGARVRAQDLIFPNQELNLYDLDGQLRINRNGIYFEPVKVRLEENTIARVTGKVDDFHDPQTILDIESDHADILQVINLFHGPHKHHPQTNHEHRPTIITVKATRGTLGDLNFTNAQGVITDHAGVFTLYPLKFQTGEGTCVARVEFDRNQPDGLLKISGHADQVDATILHQDMFKNRGLIKGQLRGDFYLEGSLGEGGFWSNALGGIHLRVKNGTLRKFNVLAKVFSILNVSQLFTFKLPDMDTEGMPFNLLEGSMKIENGWMKTEDTHVVSEAMNLSLVGRQNLVSDQLDYHLGVMPLRTVDKVVTSIPIAGWLLGGDKKAVFTAYFKIEGTSASPTVTAVPADSISDTVFGIIKRTFGLPEKLGKDIGSLFKSTPPKKQESPAEH